MYFVDVVEQHIRIMLIYKGDLNLLMGRKNTHFISEVIC